MGRTNPLPPDAPLYEGQGVVLYHGDCRDLLPSFAAGTVDLVLTDPPYGVGYTGRWGGPRRAIVGDGNLGWLPGVFAQLARVLRDDGLILTFYGWPKPEAWMASFRAAGLHPVSHVVFVKHSIGLGRYTRSQHEVAYLLRKSGGRPPLPDPAIPDVIDWQREADTWHPTQKPVSALVPVIEAFSPVGGLVLDPFAGSAATIEAARLCGRRAIGIEVDSEFAAKAARRLSQAVLFPAPSGGASTSQKLLEFHHGCGDKSEQPGSA